MPNELEFIVYSISKGDIRIDAAVKDETVCLNQFGMAKLFDVDRTTISRHLKNIFAKGKLQEKVVCAIFAHTTKHVAIEEKTQQSTSVFYNLDAIIPVDYWVTSRSPLNCISGLPVYGKSI